MTRTGTTITGILETVLYAEDLEQTLWFYRDVIGLEHISGDGSLSLGFRVAPEAVLLVFDPAMSSQAGRILPSHGTSGAGHIAFRIPPSDYDARIEQLKEAGIFIEHEERWESVAPVSGRDNPRSIYIRDPAGNSVEFITHDIWIEQT